MAGGWLVFGGKFVCMVWAGMGVNSTATERGKGRDGRKLSWDEGLLEALINILVCWSWGSRR